ncbi:MAG TPA: TIGR02265 family protein [Candidatus Paceibacterota bacterium]|nr:TIGR02265 family protein [Candidatus Paceibacterota bacterium]
MFSEPTIKGVFMRSHVKALARKRGVAAVAELQAAFGAPLDFGDMDDVLVRDEVRLLELAVRLMKDQPIADGDVALEAGRLHFDNFVSTPLGRLTVPFFKNNFKSVIMGARYLAGHIFRGVKFSSEDLGPSSVRLMMRNADYPLDHFNGFLAGWMSYCGLRGTIEAQEPESRVRIYTIAWQQPDRWTTSKPISGMSKSASLRLTASSPRRRRATIPKTRSSRTTAITTNSPNWPPASR